MKTRSIARGIVGAVASLLGVVAVGCSAETGDEAAQIGSTAEALSCSSTSVATLPVKREFASSCLVQDGANGSTKMLIVGGFNSTNGNALGDAYLFDGSSYTAVASLPAGQERGFAEAVQVPGSPTKCVLVGGQSTKSSSPAARTTAYVFTANGSTGAWASAGTMNSAHVRFQLAPLPSANDKVMAVSGYDASATEVTTVETWDGSTTWTTRANLTTGRADFALAPQSTSNDKWLVAGGENSGSSYLASLEVLALSGTTVSQKDLTGAYSKSLTTARSKLVAFPTNTTSDFLVAVGEVSGPAATTKTQAVTINWANVFSSSTGTSVAAETAAPSGLAAVALPELVKSGSDYMLVEGQDGAGNTSPRVQKFSGGSWSNVTTSCSGRTHHEAGLLGSTVYLVGGVTNPSGGSLSFLDTTPTAAF